MNRLIDALVNWLSKFSRKRSSKSVDPYEPVVGSAYGISTGMYLGEFFVYIETVDNNKMFLSLPKMLIRSVPHDTFKSGIDNKIVELQEILPYNVVELCKKQYEQAAKPDN